jgi:DNA-binding response OmpR family regulator
MYNLLLVDDDLEILEMLTLVLAGPGVRVLTAQTVAQAEYAMKYYRVDAAVLDVHLTTSNQREGLYVLRLLRQAQPTVEVIVMSGSSEPNLMNRAFRAGGWIFLRKPLELVELERHLIQLGYPTARWGCPSASVARTSAVA